MSSRPTAILVSVILTLFSISVVGQERTIPQMIEQVRPKPLIITSVSELVVASFESAIRDADLIVQGSVRRLKTYMTNDQMQLYTDFEILPTNMILVRRALGGGRPGQVASIVLRMWGGETEINGLPVKFLNTNFPELPTGRPLLLLLKYRDDVGKYELYDNAWALELKGGRTLEPLVRPTSPFEDRVIGMDIADAIREIQERTR